MILIQGPLVYPERRLSRSPRAFALGNDLFVTAWQSRVRARSTRIRAYPRLETPSLSLSGGDKLRPARRRAFKQVDFGATFPPPIIHSPFTPVSHFALPSTRDLIGPLSTVTALNVTLSRCRDVGDPLQTSRTSHLSLWSCGRTSTSLVAARPPLRRPKNTRCASRTSGANSPPRRPHLGAPQRCTSS